MDSEIIAEAVEAGGTEKNYENGTADEGKNSISFF